MRSTNISICNKPIIICDADYSFSAFVRWVVVGKGQRGFTESVEALPGAAAWCSELRINSAERKFNSSPGRWMEAPRHLEIATFKWYDDIRNPAELFFSNLAKFT